MGFYSGASYHGDEMTYKSIPSSNIVDMSPSAIRSPKTFVMGGSLKTLTQLIKSLFSLGEQGFAYDPNDLTTMWQDQAKLLPVTGAGQPVWHILDKSGNNNHAFATSSATRPILQRNATTGAYYLAFDGVDDSLQTNNIDFTATDKVSLFAGVTKLADKTQVIVELSPNTSTNAGSFYLSAESITGGVGYVSLARGSSADISGRSARIFTYPAPDVVVLSVKHDISGDLSSMRRNGVIGINGLEDKGTGNFGNYPLFIGRRAGTSYTFTGHIYSLIGIGRLTSDSETTALEKSIAKVTGVTLNV